MEALRKFIETDLEKFNSLISELEVPADHNTYRLVLEDFSSEGLDGVTLRNSEYHLHMRGISLVFGALCLLHFYGLTSNLETPRILATTTMLPGYGFVTEFALKSRR